MPEIKSKRHWVTFLLPFILSPFYMGGVVWVLQPRIVEGIIGAVSTEAGQMAVCGARDCAAIPTNISTQIATNAARLEVLESATPGVIEAGPCNNIPRTVSVEQGGPGDWVDLTLLGVCRIRAGCGAPHLSPVLINGGGRYHTLESPFEGYPLEVGECADFRIPLHLPADAHPGLGNVLMGISYPDAHPYAPNQTFGPAPLIITESPHGQD